MDYLYASTLPGSGQLGHSPRKSSEDPGRAGEVSTSQTKTSTSHTSFLRPIVQAARDPFQTLGRLAESLGYAAPKDEAGEEENIVQRQRQLLLLSLQAAKTYEEWRLAASTLDRVEGSERWKREEESDEYDFTLVKSRLSQLDEALSQADSKRMIFLVRTSLTRDLGGMGDLRLYKHSRIGTKELVERYIQTALDTLDDLVNSACIDGQDGLDCRNVMEQLLAARQAFGRSALLLSGGGTFGMNHIGVIKSLFEANLLPRIISGASAGSIVCSVLCTRLDSDIPKLLDDFCYGDLEVFTRSGQGQGLFSNVAHFLKHGVVYDISNLIRVMKGMLGDITFQEAYNRTRRILNICVSSADLYELPRLLNYVTAPNVLIWSAVAASCSVPLVFSAAQLLAKDPKTGKEVPWNPSPQRWIDGSVDNDIPMQTLAEMFNVNHFIVSQVNPHVVPFLAKEEDEIAAEALRPSRTLQAGPGWAQTVANLAKGEALHRMHLLSEIGILPTAMTKLRSVLGQRYSGNITIFPEISYSQFPAILSNPTTEFMQQCMTNGEKATWPKLSRIRNHCAIELALDDAVQKLRARVVFSPSQVDLRLNAFSRDQLVRSERGHFRRGSRGSHKSSRSTLIPRKRSSRRAVHRPVRSLVDPPKQPLDIADVPAIKVADYVPGDYTSSEENEGAGSSSPTPYSDDGNDDDSDGPPSESSFDSPPPSYPTLWSSTRQLFASASQPATPRTAAGSFGMSGLSTMATTPSSVVNILGERAPVTGTSLRGGKSEANLPELRYKRSLHNVIPPTPALKLPLLDAGAEQGASYTKSQDERLLTREKSSRFGLHLDISGTRGMVRRKKRSLGTGLKGFWGPTKQ